MSTTTVPWPDVAVQTDPAATASAILPDLSPGYKTTEFWLTLAGAIMSLLVGLHVLGPDFAKTHEAIVNALCLLAATLSPAIYALARGITKYGQAQAAAQLAIARTTMLSAVPLSPALSTVNVSGVGESGEKPSSSRSTARTSRARSSSR